MCKKFDLSLKSYTNPTEKKYLKMSENYFKSTKYYKQQTQQLELLTKTENKLFAKKRIDSIVRNQHSRAFKNTMTASMTTSGETTTTESSASWLRSLFKTNHRRRYLSHTRHLLLTIIVLLAVLENSMSLAKADDKFNDKHDNVDDVFQIATTIIPITMQQQKQQQNHNHHPYNNNSNETATFVPIMAINETLWFNHTSTAAINTNSNDNNNNTTSNVYNKQKKFQTKFNPADSIFLRFAKRFTDDNSLWSGIIQDCYKRPTFSCFQKNVYYYLNDVLETHDVNVTQRLKFFKNQNQYDYVADETADDVGAASSTASYLMADSMENEAAEHADETENEIPHHRERSFTGEFNFILFNFYRLSI